MELKTEEEIEYMRENALIVSRTLAEVAKNIKPGVTTRMLDTIAEDYLQDRKGRYQGLKDITDFRQRCAHP
jgi:methionyl aminopeptidase